jgi:collagen triple helix repeat protein
MLSRIREQLGSAGLVVAVIALIAALAGGAYAASGGLSGKQKKQVEAIAKKYAGKPGAPGVAGPQGPAGLQGAAGAAGKDGTNGKDGKDGTNGKSVLVTDADEVTQCVDVGGVMVEEEGNSASAEEVCNGPEGPEGPEGKPWTAGGVLPVGAVETGVWALNGTEADTAGAYASLSFFLPMENNVKAANVHVGEAGSGEPFTSAGICPSEAFQGSAAEPPTSAKAGHLCVYLNGAETTATYEAVAQNGKAGVILRFNVSGGGVKQAMGSFALRGCDKDLPVGDPDKCP